MFRCYECGQERREKYRVFAFVNWCRRCVVAYQES